MGWDKDAQLLLAAWMIADVCSNRSCGRVSGQSAGAPDTGHDRPESVVTIGRNDWSR